MTELRSFIRSTSWKDMNINLESSSVNTVRCLTMSVEFVETGSKENLDAVNVVAMTMKQKIALQKKKTISAVIAKEIMKLELKNAKWLKQSLML